MIGVEVPPNSGGKLKVLRLSLAFPLPLSADFRLRKKESAEVEAEVLMRAIPGIGVDTAGVGAVLTVVVDSDAVIGIQGVEAERNVGALARGTVLEPVDVNDLTGGWSIRGLLRDVA